MRSEEDRVIRHAWCAFALLLLIGSDADAAEPVASCWPSKPGTDPALCPPNDPSYAGKWEFRSTIPPTVRRERMHPAEAALGSIGFSLDAAWQHTIGRDDVVIAVLDSGIRWDYADLVNKIYLNAGELPKPAGAPSHDANGDGVFDVRDFAGDERVRDANANGRIDAEDLIAAFSNCVDEDGNGYPDDISGYDFFAGEGPCGQGAGDNNPRDDTDFGHGTGIAATAVGEANNGIGDAGVCPRCRLLPVRVGDSFVVDANRFARGVVFAVRAGASVIGAALGSYNNTPAARAAIDLAYGNGVPVIASAADEFAYHHNYPGVYNHALYVNAVRFNHADDYREATTFWGVNPCTNFGARVWITVPAESCSSGATSRLAGVTGLVESMGRESGHDLDAEQVYQVLRATADDLDNRTPDWSEVLYTARPGFDQLYGYGRLNALAAVRLVAERGAPPAPDLLSPDWFSIHSPRREPLLPVEGTIRLAEGAKGRYRLQYALGVEPAEDEYVTVAAGTVTGSKSGRLGVLDFRELPVPRFAPPRNREERDQLSVTLRLSVTDEQGLVGETRRSFFVFDDPTSKSHFPLELGASGEAPPLVLDLDRDGRAEVVVATADGVVRFIRWHPAGLRTVRATLDELAPLGPGLPRPRETVVRGPVAGDLDGSGRTTVVLASKDGKIYAFDARGERVGGFPVSIAADGGGPTSPERIVERGILAPPVLAELDGRPGLEIVVPALDGQLYVFRHDGRPLDGFPVTVAPADEPNRRSKLVSAAAVGDIDGDGKPEIVIGSNGSREGEAEAYAVRARGRRDPRGAFVPGWQPVRVPALRPDLLPTVASGVQADPVLYDADGDGDLEVLLYAVTGTSIVLLDHDRRSGPHVIRDYELSPSAGSTLSGLTFVGGTGSPLVADTDHDGAFELYAPLLPLRILTLRNKPGVPIDVPIAVGGWPMPGAGADSKRVPMLDGFPRRMEDLMLFARPDAVDVDADGKAEVVIGSGGYLLHAFEPAGGEADGFPKFTGGWIFSAASAGDLDGDGSPELVSVTREGYLFAWELRGRAR